MQEELNRALFEAAKKGDIEALKNLMHRGANIHYRDVNGECVLLWAAGMGHIAMVEYLLKHNLASMSDKDKFGTSPLMMTAITGRIPMLQYFLDRKLAEASERDNFGNSPLLITAAHGQILMFKYLLKRKLASASEKNHHGATPLLRAAANGQIPILRYLLRHELATVSETTHTGSGALVLAAGNGHYRTVQYLFKKGAYVDALTNDGYTPLQLISNHLGARKDIVSLIQAAETLLKLATRTGETSIELLNALNVLEKGINGRRVIDGNTALHLAILYKNKKVVRLLLELGADIHLCNDDKKTPMQLGLASEDLFIRQRFNLIKLQELSKEYEKSKGIVAMDIDAEDESSQDPKDAKELKGAKESTDIKEIKESKESLDQGIIKDVLNNLIDSLELGIVTENLNDLIEEIFNAIQTFSDPLEKNHLFYTLGVMLSNPDRRSCFRPVIAYHAFNTLTRDGSKQFEKAHYKAYELVHGGLVIITRSKDRIGTLEEDIEVLENRGFALPNDQEHRQLRLKTLLNHLHLANYQDKKGALFSKLSAEFALGDTESMKGISGVTGINGDSQFTLLNVLFSTRSKLEEENKRLKEEMLEREQKFIRETQDIRRENERLAAEIASLKSQMMDLSGDFPGSSSDFKKRKDNPLALDNVEPAPKRRRGCG